MKKYLSILVLFGLVFVPAISRAQVSSTVERRVVPILKKSYETAVKKQETPTNPVTRSVLKQGMAGEDVRYMQAWLYNQGYDIDIDGVFGPGTKKALIAFQKKTNGALKPDGVFGPRTALYIQELPTGLALKSLDEGTINYLKGKLIATVSGKEVTTKTITASSKVATAPVATSKSAIAKLPKDVKAVLAKALPKAPTLTQVKVASTASTSASKPVTKKPKAEIAALLSKSKVSLVTATNSGVNLVASANLNTNVSSGTGTANKEYVCAEFNGDNMCAAVSPAIAAAIKAGQLDARDVLSEILGNNGNCPFCSTNDNGGIVITSGSGGGCGAGGGPGSGEFITPEGTPVGTDPDACIPFADIAGKAYSLAVTSDNVFTAYWGLKGTDGNETLQVIGKDMNWDEPTSTGTSTQPGWKSGEAFSGTAPANVDNVYFAAFHDGWVTHGFLASLTAGGEKYETGNKAYEVAKSTVPGPVHPNDFSTTEVLNQIKNATWAQTFLVGDGEHGMSPWGIIPGIPLSAKWIFEGSDWDPEGLMANYEIYKLKICSGDIPGPTPSDLCMNFRTDENGNPTNDKSYYKVTFDEAVVVTGTPRLLIKKTATSPTVTAIFDSYADADHKVLKFVADIGSGLNNNIDSPYYEGVGTIQQVNGSTIKTVVGGKNVSTSVGTFSFTDTCGTVIAPTPSALTGMCRGIGATAGDGIAVQMTVYVTFDHLVTVVNGANGNLAIKVQGAGGNGVTLPYVYGSGTNKLTFTFTPGLPDSTPLANYLGNGKIKFKVLPSGTVVKRTSDNVSVDLSGEWDIPAASTECLVPPSTTMLSSKCVNQELDYVHDDKMNSSWGVYGVGYSEPVTVTGIPKIELVNSTGNTVIALFQNMMGTSSLSFKTADLEKPLSYYFGNNVSINLNGGTIKNAAGQNAPLSLGDFNSTTQKCSVTVEDPLTMRQPVSSMTGSCSGNDKLIEVTYKAPVTVVNSNFGLKVKDAPGYNGSAGVVYSYVSGSGTNKLTFKYTSSNPDTTPAINYHGEANKIAFYNTSTQSWSLGSETYLKVTKNEGPAKLFGLWSIPSGLLSCLPN